MASPQDQRRRPEARLLPSLRSRGFWAFVAAVVGVVAMAGGGVAYLGIEEIRGYASVVVLIGAVLLVAAAALVPRAVAQFIVGRQARYGTNVLVMTVAFFAVTVIANYLMFSNPVRIDVTATRVFTLAPQTLQVLNGLDTEIRANAFFVPSDPGQDLLAQGVRDLFDEFARHSSKFTYRFEDPDLNPALASKYNVTVYPTIVFEEVEKGATQPLTCPSTGGCTTFNEQQFLSGILAAKGDARKRVYFLTGHGERGSTIDLNTRQVNDEGYDLALEGLRRDNYDVFVFDLGQFGNRVPDDAAVLVVVGPRQDLTQVEKDALREYVLRGTCPPRSQGDTAAGAGDGQSQGTGCADEVRRGGRLIALLDPGTPSSFADLLSEWGIKLGTDSIADGVSSVAGEPLTPILQRANGQYLNAADLGIDIAEQVDVTFFPGVTFVEGVSDDPVDIPTYIRLVPLGLTTAFSWMEAATDQVRFDPESDKLGPFSVVTAVLALGTMDQEPGQLGYPPEARMVVVGDSDFAKNKFYASRDNADLFLNSVAWLAGDYELISIRPKVIPFRELLVNSRERDFIRWSSWFLPPSLMALVAAFVWWRRR